MKKILLTIFLLMPSLCFGAITHTQTPAGGTDCGSVTSCNLAFGSNTTAGNFIVSLCRYAATGRTVTMSDTGLNSYIGNAGAITASNATDGHTENVQWAHNIAGGADTVTCAVSGAASTMRFIVSEFSGVATSNAKDQSNNASGTGSTPASGTITPTKDGALIYAFEGNGATANFAAGTDFTLATRVTNDSSARIGAEYYIQPTAASHNGTFTVSQTTWSAGIVSFLPPATGATANQATNSVSGQINVNGQINI